MQHTPTIHPDRPTPSTRRGDACAPPPCGHPVTTRTFSVVGSRLSPLASHLLSALGATVTAHRLMEGTAPGLALITLPESAPSMVWLADEVREALEEELRREAGRPRAPQWLRHMAVHQRAGELFTPDGGLDLDALGIAPETLVRDLLCRP